VMPGVSRKSFKKLKFYSLINKGGLQNVKEKIRFLDGSYVCFNASV
jgi:hypothetical protein